MRSQLERERLSLVERAIGAGDVKLVAAALELPQVAGLSETAAAMLHGAWRRTAAAEEVARLELLQKTSEKVLAAGEALGRRFDEAYDHRKLDAIEKQHKAAVAA